MTLEEIFEPIAKELHLVKQHLNLQLRIIAEKQQVHDSRKHTIDRVITEFFHTSGKGLRPALVLLSAKLVSPVRAGEVLYQALIQLATAVELIHSASLIHDDVLDNAKSRRSQLSLNEQYGNKISVLTGDMLFLQAFSLLLNLDLRDWRKKQEVFQIICDTTQKMCFGEIFQHHLISEQQDAELEEYLTIIEHKTAIFMSACCRCGALLTGTDATISQTLAEFGLHFGLAFQLTDDTKDGDALVQQDIDLLPLIRDYIEKAKINLHAFNGDGVSSSLIALCDFLLPKSS